MATPVKDDTVTPLRQTSLGFEGKQGLEWSVLSRSRVRMRLMLAKQQIEKSWRCRTLLTTDTDALASLMLAAYRGTIDYDGETPDDALF